MKNKDKEPIRAVYPGSFDPMTVGHLDIIRRAAAIFDEVIVCIMVNCEKHCLFTEAQRVEQLQKILKDMDNVRVDVHHGLAVDYAGKCHARVLIRGLRSPEDFSYEHHMNYYNRRIAPEIETVYLGSAMEFVHINSGAVRELLAFGGEISGLVPKEIEEAIRERGGNNGQESF